MANGSGVQQPPAGTLSPPDSSSSASQSPISSTHGARIALSVTDVPDTGLTNRSPEDPVKASDLKDDSDGRSRESAVPAACLACVSGWCLFFVLLSSPTSLGESRFIPQRQLQNPIFDAYTRYGVLKKKLIWVAVASSHESLAVLDAYCCCCCCRRETCHPIPPRCALT